ncbi:MAG: 30S ribosomal protein S9 [Candidatus Taylorbacteria bacterium]|nr:30S ribosomal protein S9 [Candidatus Taylorbacteria bacterium]
MKDTVKYIEAVGRRKTSIARIRISESPKMSYELNGKDLNTYFPTPELRMTATDALTKSGIAAKWKVTSLLSGGGIHSQAEAFRHAFARALITYDIELRKGLKKEGFLKRDPRSKERRKFGLKKARKAPQWSKR